MIAGTLKGAVSQRLVPAPTGGGRVAVCEVLRMTGRVRDMIMDPTQTGKLDEVIAEGGYYGMQTFDQALFAPPQGRPRSRWTRRSRPRPARTTSSCSSRPTAAAARRWTTSRRPRPSAPSAGALRPRPALIPQAPAQYFTW